MALTARALADVLHAEDPTAISGMDAQERLVYLANLKALWDAIQVAGWNEHTGDWDWFIDLTVNTDRGDATWDDYYEWGFATADGVHVEMENMTACTQYEGFAAELARSSVKKVRAKVRAEDIEVTHLWLEGHDSEAGEDMTALVPIANIKRIDIREEH